MKRGQQFIHDRWIDGTIERNPVKVQITSTKRYTRSDGTTSTLVYYRPILTYTGRTALGAPWKCDIDDTKGWSVAP